MSDVRCAQWARDQSVDPIGTAGSYRGFLLVEWPLPWPGDVGEIPAFEPVLQLLSGKGIRLQAVVPTDSASRRIALYRRPEGPFRGFVGREVEYRPGEARGADRLDRSSVTGGSALAGASSLLLEGGGAPIVHREILICTHGRRDRCCGSSGTELFQSLSRCDDLADVRLRRTSHTGGHRFAPTALVLPEGTLWGYLDPDAMRRVVARQGPLDDLIPRFRGSSGYQFAEVQALERSIWAEVGWDLFAMTREAEDLGTGRWRMTLSGSSSTSVWEGRVSPGRTVPVPSCGSPLEASRKSETELLVGDLRRVQ